MARLAAATIEISEVGPQKFALSVTVDGQRFDCGNYLNRNAAQQAARLFVARKEAERGGNQKKRR